MEEPIEGQHTHNRALTFLLLEKRDVPPRPKGAKKSAEPKTAWVSLNAKNNIYEAWGSYIRNPVYQWAKETNSKTLALTKWVVYIHSNVLLRDPLSADPIIVSGSANFSTASTNDNDENMLVIRGDTRVADIYFTEFNRLFFHYYFRSVREATAKTQRRAKSLFLDETGKQWVKDYAPGKLKTKRVAVFEQMVLYRVTLERPGNTVGERGWELPCGARVVRDHWGFTWARVRSSMGILDWSPLVAGPDKAADPR